MEKKQNWFIYLINTPSKAATYFGGIGGLGVMQNSGYDFGYFLGGAIGGAMLGLVIHFIYRAFKKK